MNQFFLQALCSFGLFSLSAYAESAELKFPNADEIKNKYGVHVIGEPTVWSASKSQTGVIKLNNQHFTFEYRNCLEVFGRLGDDDPKKAPHVDLEVGKKCPENLKSVDINGEKFYGSVGLTYGNSLDYSEVGGKLLWVQSVSLNKADGKYMASVFTDCSNEPVVCAPRVRFEIVRLCPNRAISFQFSELAGQPSMDRINNRNFELPQEYKDLILSFKCEKIPPFKK